MRINRYLSTHGFCSRREADKLIANGKVTINDRLAVLGDQVSDTDIVKVNGISKQADKLVYYLLNKPIGYICTTDPRARDNVVSLVPTKPRVFPVGRLDVASSGLILLTNDGELTEQILHPKYSHTKVYIVSVTTDLTPTALSTMRSGVDVGDYTTLPCRIKKMGPRRFAITLTEGKNRQIRRMCEALGYTIKSLERVAIGSLTQHIPVGEYREISADTARLALEPTPDLR